MSYRQTPSPDSSPDSPDSKQMPVFLFTDIEGSTEKWEKYENEMKEKLPIHDKILEKNISNYRGKIIKHTGDGIFAIFQDGKPLTCAIEIQKDFYNANWGKLQEVRIRMGLHSGYAQKSGKDYFGPVINRTARVMDAAWGGQILLTSTVKTNCKLPEGARLKDFRTHMLKDLTDPQKIYGLLHPDLKLQNFPPLRSLSSHPNNLPLQTTLFIGRDEEFKQITELMHNPQCRLITLTGTGGIGKTRLAIQVGAENIENFEHGVYFVPLEHLSSSDFIISTIADSLNFNFYTGQEEKTQLLNYMEEKERLLILDNFEHLLDSAGLILDILKIAPALKILVTSREVLNLRGEWVIPIQGLKFPQKEKLAVENFDAVQLFMHNAQRVNPSLSFSKEDKHSIVHICRLVGGIPLAIEIAASWVSSLSFQEIATEIEKNIDFLTTTLRDVPERQRSLRAVFNYSWELLSNPEREAFMKLSLFRGGFTRKDSQEIMGVSLPLLKMLIDKSLVRKKHSQFYEILETLRQYGKENIDKKKSKKEKLLNTLSEYYADFLKSREQKLKKGNSVIFEEIMEEIENIRMGWEWGIKHNKEVLEKYTEPLSNFYNVKSMFREGYEEFKRAEEMYKEKDNILGLIIKGKAIFAFRLGRYEESQKLFQKSLSMFREFGDSYGEAISLWGLGNISHFNGKYSEAEKLLKESLNIFKNIEDKNGVSLVYNSLGNSYYRMNKLDKAMKFYENSLDCEQEIGFRFGEATSLNNLGNIAIVNNEYEKAKKLYQKSMEIKDEMGDKKGKAMTLCNMSLIARNLKEYNEAKNLAGEGYKIFKEIGHPLGQSFALLRLANVHSELENYTESQKKFREALNKAIKIKSKSHILEILRLVADLFLKMAKYKIAYKIILFIVNYYSEEKNSIEYSKAKQSLERIKKELSPNNIKKLKKEVKDKKMEEIIKEIIQHLQQVPSNDS